MDNIDNIVDKALDKPKKMLEEPKHIFVHRWFKTWKMFKYETESEHEAYAKFNEVMKQLMQLNNVLIDSKRSKVCMKDIMSFVMVLKSGLANFKYVAEIYWRDKEPRDEQ